MKMSKLELAMNMRSKTGTEWNCIVHPLQRPLEDYLVIPAVDSVMM